MSPAIGQNGTRKYTPEDWEKHREEIATLYENGTLESVIQFMTQQYELEATPKQYKDRIKKWGLNKHIQKDEMEAMIRIRQERRTRANKETAFLLRGRPVNEEKIDRYEREHLVQTVVDGDVDIDMDENSRPASSDIHFYTPKRAISPIPQDASNPQTLVPEAEAPPISMIPSSAQPSGYLGSSTDGQPQVPYANLQDSPPQTSQFYQLYQASQSAAPPPPPDGPQSFAPAQYSGVPRDYTFQYSHCNGRRKALLIGINYFKQRGQLQGCINDVKNMSAFLHECFGYRRDDMVILTDDQQNPMSQPTKENILRAMHWLVQDARTNDSLVFHYSGHGGQTANLDDDEADGYDEVIYPVDFRASGHIVDDEMHRIMVKPLMPGVRLTAIFDSCHSGTALDLPYIYSTQGVLKEPNLAKEAGQGLLGSLVNHKNGRSGIGSMAQSVTRLFKKSTTSDGAYKREEATKTSSADVIMFSGSPTYNQTSADTNITTQATGAMSWAFINAMKKNPQQSYVQLLVSISDELATRYTQIPQLSCSHPLDANLLYVM